MTARRLFLFGFAAVLLTGLGCSGGGGDGGTPSPAIVCVDGGAAAANTITLTCAGATDSTTELVNVVLGGPAAGNTTTLRGLNFDVKYDPSKLEFVPAGSYTSPLIPSDLPPVVTLLNGLPGQLVVSIERTGNLPDPVQVAAGQNIVLSLTFRRAPGVTNFGPAPLEFVKAEATTAVPAISYPGVSGLALSY